MNSPSNSSSLIDLITPLQSSISTVLFDRLRNDVSLRETRLNSEQNVLVHKVELMSEENDVLDKKLRQIRAKYGELLLRDSDNSRKISELRHELCEVKNLREDNESLSRTRSELVDQVTESRVELNRVKEEVEVLREDNKRSRENYEAAKAVEEMAKREKYELNRVKEEVEILKEENKRLRENYEAAKEAEETVRRDKYELNRVKEEVEVLKEENKRMRENYEALKAAEETARREKDEVLSENQKLKLDKEAVTDVATIKLRSFERRVGVLESNVANLKVTFDDSGHVGEQRVSITHARETIEILDSDEKVEGLVGTRSICEATPIEEKSASSLSCRQGVSTVKVKEPPKSFGSDTKLKRLVKCQAGSKTKSSAIEKKTTSLTSKPFIDKCLPESLPICISDSDDDEPKGVKRKLDFTDGSDHSKTPISAPRSCTRKVTDTRTDMEVEFGCSAKHWEYEADMVQDLEKNTEICMQAICALYRQHVSVGRSKGFIDIDAFRGVVLGKFLVGGDKEGRLKKSLADLEDYDSEGASRCRSIAITHSSWLFEIYKSKKDPYFAPPN